MRYNGCTDFLYSSSFPHRFPTFSSFTLLLIRFPAFRSPLVFRSRWHRHRLRTLSVRPLESHDSGQRETDAEVCVFPGDAFLGFDFPLALAICCASSSRSPSTDLLSPFAISPLPFYPNRNISPRPLDLECDPKNDTDPWSEPLKPTYAIITHKLAKHDAPTDTSYC
jgi:hypothetical protein